MTLSLNGLSAIKVELNLLWRGIWTAEVELDLDDPLLAPLSGAAVLIVPGGTLTGTIDAAGSGTFLNRASVRVVGGAGGWDTAIAAQHFHNPAGALTSAVVYQATASAVGETVVDASPRVLGVHSARLAGPASGIFSEDTQWYVHPLTGVTMVADWLPSIPDPNWVIGNFDIHQQRVSITSDSLIFPGTPITDSRFNGSAFVARDVQQTFSAEGSRAEVWVSESTSSRLQRLFSSLVAEAGHLAYLRTYRYRFVIAGGSDGELALQAITPGAPDLNPLEQWGGTSGLHATLLGVATLQPSSEIVVGFCTPTDPYIVAYSPEGTPTVLSVDVSLALNVAGGFPLSPVALAVPLLGAMAATVAMGAAIQTALAASSAALVAVCGIAPLLPAHATAAGAATSATATSATAIAAASALITQAAAVCASTKLFSL